MALPSRTPRWLGRAAFYAPYMALCTDEAGYRRMLKKLGMTPDSEPWCKPGRANVRTLEAQRSKDIVLLVCIDPADYDPIVIVSMLVHEATHMKQRTMEFIGEKHPSDEFEAYVMQNLIDTLLVEFKRQMYGEKP